MELTVTGDGDTSRKPSPAVDEEMVRSLARLLDETRLTEIEIEQSGLRVKVVRQPAPIAPVAAGYATSSVPPGPQPAAGMAVDLALHPGIVTSPMVGTAYRAPEPGGKPFCDIGSVVKTGDTLLVIEAMKTINLIPAPRAGTVAQILFEDAQPVEFGEPLMIVE
jgi:acetyl-CoA carboxylase biotin carboxyl carrier protein